jgi:hypothetical protein
MGQKGTSCNVTIQFQIQIIHAIWLAYGWTMELSLPVEYVVMTSTTLEWHWLWMEETQHTKKNYSSWCLKKPFVNSTCHWISPRTLKLFFDKKTETTKIPRKRLCNDIYDTCHNWKTFKTLFLKLIGPFMITNTFFDNNTWIGSFQWKGIWKDQQWYIQAFSTKVKLLFQGCHNKINVLVDVTVKLTIKIKIYR